MFLLPLLAAVAFPLVSAETVLNSDGCGRRASTSSAQARIVGGLPLESTGNYPWSASLWYPLPDNSTLHMCGGAIINSNWVLTAGHCFTPNVSEATVLVGYSNLTEAKALFNQSDYWFAVKKMILSECYAPVGHDVLHDVALIQIRGSFASVFSLTGPNPVWPLCLVEQNQSVDTDRAFETAGWGRTGQTQAESTESSEILLWTNQFYLSFFDLELIQWIQFFYYFGTANTFNPNLIVAHNFFNATVCHGDSGGLLVQSDVRNNETVMFGIGITSYIMGSNCDVTNTLSFYTKVASYRNWIDEKIAQFDQDPGDGVLVVTAEEQCN